jgi:high affinity Mn2+ porin
MTPTISAVHQVYFAAGGHSASIWDDQLPHQARGERIVDIFYMLPIYLWMLLTFDYQCAANPPHDRNRRPVSVGS